MLREIKKKTAVYGALAILLATMLGAVCLNFGIRPLLPSISASALSTFSSYEELEDYLMTNQEAPYYYLEMSDLPRMALPSDVAPSSAYLAGVLEGADVNTIVPKSGPEYSVTNVQVAGVDEADLVKTDGEYMYVVSGNNLTILSAYPAENATILCQISLNGTLRGIFINGDKLAVFGESYFYQPVETYYVANTTVRMDEATTSAPLKVQVFPYQSYATGSETFIKVYNVSDRANPSLTRDVTVNGTYFSSRMIGDYVYVVTSQPTYWHNSRVVLPMIVSLNKTKIIQPNEIYYSSISDNSYAFTIIVSIDLKLDETDPLLERTVISKIIPSNSERGTYYIGHYANAHDYQAEIKIVLYYLREREGHEDTETDHTAWQKYKEFSMKIPSVPKGQCRVCCEIKYVEGGVIDGRAWQEDDPSNETKIEGTVFEFSSI